MKFVTILICYAWITKCAVEVPRRDPIPSKYVAPPEYMNVAESQLFKIPLSEAISQRIIFVPHHQGDCTISSATGSYRELTSRPLDKTENSMITSTLVLSDKGYVYTIDQNFMLAAYQMEDGALKSIGKPKRVLSQKGDEVSNPILVATPDQQTVYVLSIEGVSVFSAQLHGTNARRLRMTPTSAFMDGIIVGEFLYTACADNGLHVYKILIDKELLFIERFGQHHCVDLEYDREQNLLYTVDKNQGVYVYSLESNGKPHLQDTILTKKYTSGNLQVKVNNKRMLIFFKYNSKYFVGEFNYDRFFKKFTFIRYFKFTYELNQIYIVSDYFIGIGKEYIGVFPIGIHPKLVKHQQNGWMAISNVTSARVIYENQIIGVTNDKIVYGEVELQRTQQIECIQDKIQTVDTIIYQANLTKCSIAGGGSQDSQRQYYEYCEYEKAFYIDRMKIVVNQFAKSMLTGLFLLIFGLLVFSLLVAIMLTLCMKSRIRRLRMRLHQTKRMLPIGTNKSLFTGIGRF